MTIKGAASTFINSVPDTISVVTDPRSYLGFVSAPYTVKPLTTEGIGGFLFDYEGKINVELNSEITDHFSEDTTSIQDHIALKPVKLRLHGFVAELVSKAPTGIAALLGKAQVVMGSVPAYLGNSTPQALQKIQQITTSAQSTLTTLSQGVQRAQNLISLFPGAWSAVNAQAKAFAKLYSMWRSKQIFYVNTPYKLFPNMAIEALSFTQDDETKYITDIMVTLKEIRIAAVQYTTFDPKKYAGDANAQAEPNTNQGITPPKNVSAAQTVINATKNGIFSGVPLPGTSALVYQ